MKILILYGSETGTAQDVAERIWREAKSLQFKGPVMPMDEFDITQLIYQSLVIFVCSTTGQGDQPLNMKNFWKFLLRKSLPSNSLIDMKFAVLGLGDSSYVKFNYAAKKLYKRLVTLGGKAVCDVGLADDQHDLGADAVIDPWIQILWEVLSTYYQFPEKSLPLSYSTLPESRWNVEIIEECAQPINFPVGDESQQYDLKVKNNIRTTTPEHFQEVRLIKLKSDKRVVYSPGDVLMVRPQNRRQAVNHLMTLLGGDRRNPQITEETVLKVTPRDSDMPVPNALNQPLTLYSLANSYWDLNAIPRRYVFQLLAHMTTSDLEKEKLQEMSSPEGQEELFSYCSRPRRSIVEVLADFPHASANIPVSYLFDIFHPIRPRAFSIASAPSVHHHEIHILVAVVHYSTKLFVPRYGLCSTWLASLGQDQVVQVAIRRGSFTFPDCPVVPIIMVGPGTGVAPFRSYITETYFSQSIEQSIPDLTLIFGCRNREGDFHFKDEWNEMDRLRLFTAFSRDQPHKIYVQQIIENESEVMAELIYKNGAMIYVAGNAKDMPTAVQSAFVLALKNHANMSIEGASAYVEMMSLNGRYQTETWS